MALIEQQNGSDSEDPELEALKALQREVAALDAEAAAVEAQTAEATKVQRKQADVEAARRKLSDVKLVAKFTAELGPKGKMWDSLETASGTAFFKRTPTVIFKRWCDEGQSLKSADLTKLVNPALLHPTVPEFDRWCDEEPATPMRAANVVNRLAGARAKDLEGK
jgi:hypothetical protein